ncbi:MAG: hypothetical protein IJN90_07350 [Bacilli bacterium]|nr:hypothetical protein [Bacilli bacterium]
MSKKLLSLTLNELINVEIDDVLLMIEDNIKEVRGYGDDYTRSIAIAIVKRVMLIKNFSHQYEKFYRIITSEKFMNNEGIKLVLDEEEFIYLKDLYEVYRDLDTASLIDSIFLENEKLFDLIVIDQSFSVKDVFSSRILNSFYQESYKKFLSYLLKDNDKSRVINALFKSKNNKFLYMVSKMDDLVLSKVEDDNDYFDAVLTLLNYNNYRKLLWDYYNRFVVSEENEKILNTKFKDEVPDELNDLLCYTFNLMSVIYANDTIPDIISNIDDLTKSFNLGKEMVHIAVFGVEGYKKFKDNTFDVMLDFPKMDNENQLLNLKIAFFSTIYGLTYNQAEKLIESFDDFMKNFRGTFNNKENLVYETIIAMKSLYNLKLEDKEEIDLYREVYYKYVKKNGIYASTEVEALVIMESLMRRMYNNSIELL